MRERPLSIVIIGWFNIMSLPIMVALYLSSRFFPELADPNGPPSALLLGFNLLLGTLGTVSAVLLLKGMKFAPPAYLAVQILGFGPLFAAPHFDARALLMPLVTFAAQVWFLYRPRAVAFFNATSDTPPITRHAVNALYYCLVGAILAAGIGMCGYTGYMQKTAYLASLPFLVPAAVVYVLGAVVGLLLHPKRDTGAILIAGAVLGFLTALSGTIAPSPDQLMNTSYPELAAGYSAWSSGLVALVPLALGALLIHLSNSRGERMANCTGNAQLN